MSDRAEDLNEWRSEQYTKNAKSYESKVVLTLDEAKAIHKYLWDTVGTIHVDKAQGKMIGSFIKKVWWKLNADDEGYDS